MILSTRVAAKRLLRNVKRNTSRFSRLTSFLSKHRFGIIYGVVAVLVCVAYIEVQWGLIHTVTYLSRPIWDRQEPRNVIKNFGYFGKESCALHGARDRNGTIPRVFDCVVFSLEVELLETRLFELWDVVDRFVIVEADITFRREPKDMVFQREKARFAPYMSKIEYVPLKSSDMPNDGNHWDVEWAHRQAMTRALRKFDLAEGDLVIVADCDEIPRKNTVELFRHCDFGKERVGLQVRVFYYSFEFTRPFHYTDRPSIVQLTPKLLNNLDGVVTHSGFASDIVLADAGWHCTFCFRNNQNIWKIFSSKCAHTPISTVVSGEV
eukprot:155779_1